MLTTQTCKQGLTLYRKGGTSARVGNGFSKPDVLCFEVGLLSRSGRAKTDKWLLASGARYKLPEERRAQGRPRWHLRPGKHNRGTGRCEMPRTRQGRVSISFAALAAALSIFLAAPSYGQVAGATLTGTVSDPTGAVIPRAQVSIRNTGTDVVRVVEANTDGLYTAP